MRGIQPLARDTSCLNYGGRSSWPGMLWASTQHETCCWALGANIMPFCLWETHWDLFFFLNIENKSDRVRSTLCFLGLGGLSSRKDLTCTVASSDLEFSALFIFCFPLTCCLISKIFLIWMIWQFPLILHHLRRQHLSLSTPWWMWQPKTSGLGLCPIRPELPFTSLPLLCHTYIIMFFDLIAGEANLSEIAQDYPLWG